MRRPAAVLFCFILLAACATSGHRDEPEAYDSDLTLCVANESEGVGTIRVYVETFRALTVASGRRECRPILEISSGTRLFAQSMGGGMRGPVQYEGVITNSDVRCWDWVLRDSSSSEIHLVPCEFHDGRR
jgi:hypothetical protein